MLVKHFITLHVRRDSVTEVLATDHKLAQWEDQQGQSRNTVGMIGDKCKPAVITRTNNPNNSVVDQLDLPRLIVVAFSSLQETLDCF